MNDALTHEDIGARDLVERYVSRQLSDDETKVFESHFLTCERCQADIEVATVLRTVATAHPEPARAKHRVPARLVWSTGFALAAGIVLVALWPRGSPIEDLGSVVQPPLYLAVPLRSAITAPESVFNSGMEAYQQSRYGEAATSLARALQLGADTTRAGFFHGASLLMLDQPVAAADAFQRVIGRGDTPYLVEAHYYRAKALLQTGRPGDALAHLAVVEGADHELSTPAHTLADSINARLRR